MLPDPIKMIERIKNYVSDFKAGNDIKKYAELKEIKLQPKKKNTMT